MLKEANKKKGMHGLIVLLSSIFIVIVISKYMQQTRHAQIEYMEDNGAYTIGKIVEYSSSTQVGIGNGYPQAIDFSYSVQGKEYETRYSDRDYPVPKDYGPKEGEQFMAIYLPKEPEKCALLFNYPVKDSANYKKYIEKFKTKRPTLGN